MTLNERELIQQEEHHDVDELFFHRELTRDACQNQTFFAQGSDDTRLSSAFSPIARMSVVKKIVSMSQDTFASSKLLVRLADLYHSSGFATWARRDE